MSARRMICRLAATLCLLLVLAGAGFSQDEEPVLAEGISAKLDIAYVSKYIWRGNVLNPDSAVQPSLTFSHPSGLSFNWWGSMDSTDIAGERGNFTEHDYTLNYAWNAGEKSMNAGYVYYAFPNTLFASTQEVYASACLGGPLSPTLSANYDFDEARGAYVALAAGYCCKFPSSKALANPMTLSAKLGFGTASYNKFYFFGNDKAALTDFVVGASVPIEAGNLTFTPSVSYSTVVDGGLRDSLSAGGVRADNFVAGLTVSSEF
ncbi:MAG: hypothetical protein M1133_04600 [Armatimonadetes bacterium]|nr:hypothetical protein [Armatimonadota bacterium]